MKTCSKCRKRKSLDEFGLKYGKPIETCKECRRLYAAAWYKKNRKLHYGRVKKAAERNLAENREFVGRYLKEHPCVDCGETDPIVLEFDHLGNKKMCVSRAKHSYTLAKLQEEVAKCEVRCANCHRRKTAKQQGWHIY